MQKILYGLIELQEVDTRLDELREERGDLPLIVEELQNKLNEKKASLTALTQDLKNAKVRQRELENLIKESKAKFEKYEEQLYQVKTNREYDAITLETETAKSQLESANTDLAETQDTIKSLDENILVLGEEIEKLEGELEENSIELNSKLNETAEEENLLKQERDIIIKQSNPEIIKTYELVREARSGQGIAKIDGNVCGGCYSYIPPQKVVEVKKMKIIYTCEYCGRILVWENSEK